METPWETFDELYQTLRNYARKVEGLEKRIEELELKLNDHVYEEDGFPSDQAEDGYTNGRAA